MRAGEWRYYNVVLTYNRLPSVRVRVAAKDEGAAIGVAVLDATAKGWPREYQSAHVEIGS